MSNKKSSTCRFNAVQRIYACVCKIWALKEHTHCQLMNQESLVMQKTVKSKWINLLYLGNANVFTYFITVEVYVTKQVINYKHQKTTQFPHHQ